MEHDNCRYCGAHLRAKSSRLKGVGPECAKIWRPIAACQPCLDEALTVANGVWEDVDWSKVKVISAWHDDTHTCGKRHVDEFGMSIPRDERMGSYEDMNRCVSCGTLDVRLQDCVEGHTLCPDCA